MDAEFFSRGIVGRCGLGGRNNDIKGFRLHLLEDQRELCHAHRLLHLEEQRRMLLLQVRIMHQQ